MHVPVKIEISSRLGEGTSEVRLEFFFLKKELFEKEMKEITLDFANALGTAWIGREDRVEIDVGRASKQRFFIKNADSTIATLEELTNFAIFLVRSGTNVLVE